MKNLIMVCLILGWPLMASTTSPRPAHYTANIEASNWAEAKTLYDNRQQAMQAAVEAKDWDKVHQLSYDMEKAVAIMQADTAKLAEALEAVHIASEKKRPTPIQEAFEELDEIHQRFDTSTQ